MKEHSFRLILKKSWWNECAIVKKYIFKTNFIKTKISITDIKENYIYKSAIDKLKVHYIHRNSTAIKYVDNLKKR